MKTDKIISFIQQTLGCGCNPEVFNFIDYQRHIYLDKQIEIESRINIGNRLLVYLVDFDPNNQMKNNIDHVVNVLLNRGKNERDAKKFNRFRLVLVSRKIDDELFTRARDVFKEFSHNDEKLHLHILQGSIEDFIFE